jgi:hypothetical protein
VFLDRFESEHGGHLLPWHLSHHQCECSSAARVEQYKRHQCDMNDVAPIATRKAPGVNSDNAAAIQCAKYSWTLTQPMPILRSIS